MWFNFPLSRPLERYETESIGRKADYSWTDDNKGFVAAHPVNRSDERKYMKYTDKLETAAGHKQKICFQNGGNTAVK